jgi:outer membrane protein TolC
VPDVRQPKGPCQSSPAEGCLSPAATSAMPPIMPSPRAHSPLPFAPAPFRLLASSSLRLCFPACLLVLAACSPSLRDVDARAQRLTHERSRALGGGAHAPTLDAADPADTQRPSQWDRRPLSNNPAAQELHYRPADEARDIAARLDRYTEDLQPADPSAVIPLTLTEALRIAQAESREHRSAEEEYILAAIRLLIERHLWGPRLFNDTSLSIFGQGDDGDFRSAVGIINELRLAQRLPYGGSVEAAFITRATDQLRQTASGGYTQSSELILRGDIPLLRGAGLVAQESLIQAERSLVYAARRFENFRRDLMLALAIDYFNLLELQANIQNQVKQVERLELILRGERSRFEAGRIAQFRVAIAENDVLNARATLASQRESFILALERFKLRVGIAPERPITLDPVVPGFPEPDIQLHDAVRLALEFRLDLQNQRDALDDAGRAVAVARNQLLPDLDLGARVGIPTDPDDRTGGVAISPDNLSYNASITFGLPLDREQERLRLRQSTINFQRAQRELELLRDRVAIDARQSVRNIDLARFQLQLAEQRVRINQSRVEEVRLKQDQVDTQTQVDAANALQQAENARERARTDLRIAILSFLRDTGQLRIARSGAFERLPGMDEAPEPAPDPS